MLDWWIAKAGTTDARKIERKHIIAAMEANAKHSVRFARYVVEVSSVLFEHAIDIGWLKKDQNPAKGVRKVKTAKADQKNRRPWPRELVEAYRAAYPYETRERLLLELGLGTGQRIGDILTMEWGHIRGDAIDVDQNKTGKEVLAPLTDHLRAALAAHRGINARRSVPTILANEQRRGPWSYRGASQAFRNARETIGALAYDMHCMRHTAATELREAGCSTEQISAITGMSEKMVKHYTQHAERETLARQAADLRAKRERERQRE